MDENPCLFTKLTCFISFFEKCCGCPCRLIDKMCKNKIYTQYEIYCNSVCCYCINRFSLRRQNRWKKYLLQNYQELANYLQAISEQKLIKKDIIARPEFLSLKQEEKDESPKIQSAHEKDKQTTLSDHSQISDKDDKLGSQRSGIFPRENEDESDLEEHEELLRVQSKSEAMALSQIPLMKDFQKPRRTIISTQSQIFPEINSPLSPNLKKNETISDTQELKKQKFELKRKQFEAKYPKKEDIVKFDITRDEI